MMKILIADYHSIYNPGDVGIVLGTIKLLKNIYGESCEITMVSRTAIMDAPFFKKLGYEIIPSCPNLEVFFGNSVIKNILNIPRSLLSFSKLKNKIKEADVIFMCGGGYLYSYRRLVPGFHYISNILPAVLANFFKKKLILLPQSYGPFRSAIAKVLFGFVLSSSVKIYCREKISYQYLCENYIINPDKIAVVPDLAFYFKPNLNVVKNNSSNTIGITVRSWQNELQNKRYLNEMTNTVITIQKKYKNINFNIIVQVTGPTKSENDILASKKFYNELLKKGIKADKLNFFMRGYGTSFLEELMSEYASCKLLIGTRFHSAIFSLIQNIPILVVGYQHKAKGIMNLLGLENLYVGDFDNIQSYEIIKKVDFIFENYETVCNDIKRSLTAVRSGIVNKLKQDLTIISQWH